MPYHITTNIKISKLKLLRKSNGLTQKELSDATGIPLKSIGNYEQHVRDLNKASSIIVYKLAIALNCRMEDLIEI